MELYEDHDKSRPEAIWVKWQKQIIKNKRQLTIFESISLKLKY